MKITDVKTEKYTAKEDMGKMGESGSFSEIVLVEVLTDEGVTGRSYIPTQYSRSLGRLSDHACAILNKNLKRIVLGQDPFSYQFVWEKIYNSITRWGRRGLWIHCLGAIDIALWDIIGKVAKQPLWKLLGGYREKVPVYANCAFTLPPEQLAKRALEYVEQGFKGVKFRGGMVDATPEVATCRIKAVREAVGPDVAVMVDINGTWDADTAIRMCRKWERYDLFWIEEPVHPDDIPGFKRLKRTTSIPIATGEQHTTRFDFRQLIESGAVDIIQPGVRRVGGVTEWMKIWSLATMYSIPLAPPTDQYLHAHMLAAVPNTVWIEFCAKDNAFLQLQHNLFREPHEPKTAKDSYIDAPRRPGVGLELDPEAARLYSSQR